MSADFPGATTGYSSSNPMSMDVVPVQFAPGGDVLSPQGQFMYNLNQPYAGMGMGNESGFTMLDPVTGQPVGPKSAPDAQINPGPEPTQFPNLMQNPAFNAPAMPQQIQNMGGGWGRGPDGRVYEERVGGGWDLSPINDQPLMLGNRPYGPQWFLDEQKARANQSAPAPAPMSRPDGRNYTQVPGPGTPQQIQKIAQGQPTLINQLVPPPPGPGPGQSITQMPAPMSQPQPAPAPQPVLRSNPVFNQPPRGMPRPMPQARPTARQAQRVNPPVRTALRAPVRGRR